MRPLPSAPTPRLIPSQGLSSDPGVLQIRGNRLMLSSVGRRKCWHFFVASADILFLPEKIDLKLPGTGYSHAHGAWTVDPGTHI